MEAQQPADDHDGQVGGDVHQRGVAGGVGADADLLEPVAQLGCGQRPSGIATGKQPRRLFGQPDGAVAAAPFHQTAHEFVQGRGHVGGDLAQPHGDLVTVVDDVLGGQLSPDPPA
ncbi:hypothetical protein [Streptomyces sp. NPDC059460]|uniref:hypothetical protein n=1 Tax=Streptomyces sp. NPDC059460 TaxID=3346840 RepID=UPI0036A0BC4F